MSLSTETPPRLNRTAGACYDPAMRKIIIIVCAILILCSTAGFGAARGSGFAIGGEGSLYFAGSGGLPASAMLTFHLPRLPLMLAIGVSNPFAIAMTGDYWFYHHALVSILDFYAGLGGYFSFNPNAGNGSLGARLPLGIQLWPFGQVLEIFVEVAPALGVSLVPTGFEWHFQGAVGFRIWF